MKCFLLAPNGCLFFFSPAAFFPASHVILRGFWQCSIKPIPLLICWHYLSPRSSVATASVPLRQMCCDEDELQERGEQHNTFFFHSKKEEDQQSAVELLLAANSRLCFPVLLNLSATNENKDEHFACLLLESFIVFVFSRTQRVELGAARSSQLVLLATEKLAQKQKLSILHCRR